jgi:hypothetical protein
MGRGVGGSVFGGSVCRTSATRNEATFLSTGKKVLLVFAVFAVGFYFWWPQISKLGMLTPAESELHSYMKQGLRAEREALQQFKRLQSDPGNAEIAAKLNKLGDKMQAVNDEYWVDGTGGISAARKAMNRIRGLEDPRGEFLTTWAGPEQDLAALDPMRTDTRTLAYHAWYIKEDGNNFAGELDTLLADGPPGEGAELQKAAKLAETCWLSIDRGDFIYRKWKGSFRSPLSTF